uniref:Uncharacterized protein n=1 Tax=Colobus angolensis palliatus TaxID=336983 RepID=A0A2K5IBN6_COLAP
EVEGRRRGSHELVITEERCGFCVSFNFSRIKKLKKYTCPGRARFAFSHVCHTPLHSQLGELQTGKPQALLASANCLSRSMGPPGHHLTTLILISPYT